MLYMLHMHDGEPVIYIDECPACGTPKEVFESEENPNIIMGEN